MYRGSRRRWLQWTVLGVCLSGCVLVNAVQAAVSPMVYVRAVSASMDTTYKRVFTELENNGFFILSEHNLGRDLASLSRRWGSDYNRNRLDSVRSMVFCNAWYANRISNADPDMLALCPLHLTLIHKGGTTRILFVRPSRVAVGSAAEPVALELEQDVIRAIDASVGVADAASGTASHPGAHSGVSPGRDTGTGATSTTPPVERSPPPRP